MRLPKILRQWIDVLTHPHVPDTLMGNGVSYVEVGPPPGFDDLIPSLRQPKIEFGRCAITGQFGKCVAVDLGNITVDEPNPDAGYYIDDKGKVMPNAFRPAIFASQVTLSVEGLSRLAVYLGIAESPIPGITPAEIYQWEIQFKNGTTIRQFYHEGTEEKRNTEDLNCDIDWGQALSLTIRPHNQPEGSLPFYSYSVHSGDFFRNGVAITDLDYEVTDNDPTTFTIVYFKKVHHTFGTGVLPGSMERQFTGCHSTMLQVFGWADGGLAAVLDPDCTKSCCLIGIDERGEWRPYLYR